MLARVQIGYGAREELVKLNRDQYIELRSIWGLQLPEWKSEAPDMPVKEWYGYGSEVVVDTSELALLQKAGISHVVKEIKGMYTTHAKDPSGNHYETKVVLPGLGLLQIDEVTWMEDACTEDLQRNLDDGWRIMAVCPPNGTRRPTYILGRTRAQKDAIR